VLLEVPAVEPVEQHEVLPLGQTRKLLGRVEVEDPRLLGAKHRALVEGRHEPARPVDHAIHGVSSEIGKNHVGWQLL